MTSYTVYKILENGTKQLLLVQGRMDDGFSLCVYDDHTGSTLMRLTQPTIAEFTRALALLED